MCQQIDKGELKAAMEKGGMKPTDAEVDGLVAEFDTSGATKEAKQSQNLLSMCA